MIKVGFLSSRPKKAILKMGLEMKRVAQNDHSVLLTGRWLLPRLLELAVDPFDVLGRVMYLAE